MNITSGSEESILSTASGMAIRFNETDVRPMGRDAAGVNGIGISEADRVVSMTIVIDGGALLTICENGYGKITEFGAYRTQRRGGKGLIDIRTTARNGSGVSARTRSCDRDAMIMTSGGRLVRSLLEDVRPIGRNNTAVRLIRVKSGDKYIGL